MIILVFTLYIICVHRH